VVELVQALELALGLVLVLVLVLVPELELAQGREPVRARGYMLQEQVK